MRFFSAMPRAGKSSILRAAMLLVALVQPALSCLPLNAEQVAASARSIELLAINVDDRNPERKTFGALTLMSAFQLSSKHRAFGGLSGLTIGTDGKLYAVSDRGYWFSARMLADATGALVDLVDWQIAPILATNGAPVAGSWRDAEALAQTKDGPFLVAFEGVHRVWRYAAPPKTFESIPTPVPIPPLAARAPGNGGIEALAALPDGRLLALTEEFKNSDGSFKGWIIDGGSFAELSYLPADGFRVTDGAALANGDVIVLERSYKLFGILAARLTLVKFADLGPGARLVGKELLKLAQPLAAENYEAVAVQQTPKGTFIYIVSDDNYSSFQQTLLLQFLLPGH